MRAFASTDGNRVFGSKISVGSCRIISVIALAHNRFVRMPKRWSSTASVELRAFRPPFAAAYDENPTVPLTRPPM